MLLARAWRPNLFRVLGVQQFETMPEAREADFQSATERILHTAEAPSGLEVTILPAATA